MIYPSPAWPLCAHPHVIRLHSCRVLPLVSAARVRPGPPAGRPVKSLRKRTEHRPKREQLAATISHHSSGTRLACPVTLWITTSSMAPFSELTSSIKEFSPRGERRGERADRLHSVTFRDGGKTFTETATTGYSDLQVATINCRGRRGGPSQSLVPNVSPPTRIAQSTHEKRGRLSGGSARAAGSGVRTRCCFPNTSRTRRLQNADIACASLAAKLAKVRGDETSKLAVRGVDKFVVLETHQRGPWPRLVA